MKKIKYNEKRQAPSHTIRLYIGGKLNRIEQVCSDYVTEVGWCVNVKPTNFIYSYGEQSGAEIEIISYPKFSPTLEENWNKAKELTYKLIEECNQKSATIIDDNESLYIERNGVE